MYYLNNIICNCYISLASASKLPLGRSPSVTQRATNGAGPGSGITSTITSTSGSIMPTMGTRPLRQKETAPPAATTTAAKKGRRERDEEEEEDNEVNAIAMQLSNGSLEDIDRGEALYQYI